jgi:hypothetical protein
VAGATSGACHGTAGPRLSSAAIARRHSNAEIAAQLQVSLATVKAHVSRLLAKLGVANLVQIALPFKTPSPAVPRTPADRLLAGIAGRFAQQAAQVTRYRLHAAGPSPRRHVAVRPDQDDIIVRGPRDEVEVFPVGPQRGVAQHAGCVSGRNEQDVATAA